MPSSRSVPADRPVPAVHSRRDNCPFCAFTLVEVMVVLIIVAAFTAFCVPSFERVLEESRADAAGANLRAIWAAQRLFWLENREYTNDIDALKTAGLLDLDTTASGNRYDYSIDADADADSFTARAMRSGVGSARWSGTFTINQNGDIAGVVTTTGGIVITPGYQ